MRVGAGDLAEVEQAIAGLGATAWVRLVARGASIHVAATTGDFDYVRFRRISAGAWQLEELRPKGNGLAWAAVRATRRAKLETLLARWGDPRHVTGDLKWDPKEAKRTGAAKAARRARASSWRRDPEPLVQIAKCLTRRDPGGLEKELRLAVERPEAYFKRFAKRLARRGIDAHGDVAGSTLPWIALVNGLAKRRALVEVTPTR